MARSTIIGVSGGIGSGKTTVCRLFQVLGIPTYYADDRAKYLMQHHKPLKSKMKDILGAAAYDASGGLNRKYIADKIFANQDLLQRVNNAVHPVVQSDAEQWANDQNAPYCLYEAALLVENESYKNLAALIIVTAPEDIRISRVAKRDGVPHEAVIARIRNQLPEEAKVAAADYVINNDGKTRLTPQVWAIHQSILSRYLRDDHHTVLADI